MKNKKVSDTVSATLRDVMRLMLVALGALLMGFNIKSFVNAGDLFPGGFTGLSLLIQEIFHRYAGISVPFSIINLLLNAFPVIISFKFIGHRFTIFSCVMIVLASFFTDMLPSINISNDVLLDAVFGGFINACAISICLFAGATSGGTDFIAIYFSERHGKDAWNYVLIGNAVVLLIAGYLFGWDRALYSIFFQFTSTQALKLLYRKYQRLTMLIITAEPQEVYTIIKNTTHHDATLFTGIGCYKNTERHMLYSVVSADEVHTLVPLVKKADPGAFVNVLKTDHVTGRFYQRPND
ncbi:MAG TPA: YitT family protein [Candidatus Treponema faecavium]|nr:YitT family protein [Candidatus Treponema faecavium]